MLRRYNGCVDCAIPCVGGYCAEADCIEVCCDWCERTSDTFYILEGEALCQDCYIESALENAVTKKAYELID